MSLSGSRIAVSGDGEPTEPTPMTSRNRDFILFAGAPGTGKSTVCRRLRERYGWPLVELAWLRGFHLDPGWANASEREEQMAFENLVAILCNYRRYGYHNVLVNDLEDFRVQQFPSLFADTDFVIISLVVERDEEHVRRLLDPQRDSGFRDVDWARTWNRELRTRPLVDNEHRLETADWSIDETVDAVERIIRDELRRGSDPVA